MDTPGKCTVHQNNSFLSVCLDICSKNIQYLILAVMIASITFRSTQTARHVKYPFSSKLGFLWLHTLHTGLPKKKVDSPVHCRTGR